MQVRCLLPLLLCASIMSALPTRLVDAATPEPAATGWVLSRRLGDIGIYRRPVRDSGFPALQARVRFLAPPEKIFGVLSDYDRFREFIPNVRESRVILRQGDRLWVYQRLRFPWPASDRHYVIRIANKRPEAGQGPFLIRWVLDKRRSDALASTRAVRPRQFSGSWRLTPVADGPGTDAIYEIHVDPGGLLPSWLFASVGENFLFEVAAAVRQRVAARRPKTFSGRHSAAPKHRQFSMWNSLRVCGCVFAAFEAAAWAKTHPETRLLTIRLLGTENCCQNMPSDDRSWHSCYNGQVGATPGSRSVMLAWAGPTGQR